MLRLCDCVVTQIMYQSVLHINLKALLWHRSREITIDDLLVKSVIIYYELSNDCVAWCGW